MLSRVVPGSVERDQPLLAEQPIDQRRLADVRPADHRDLRSVLLVERGASVAGDALASTSVSSSSSTPWPCSARDADDVAETERVELGRRDLAEHAFRLVDRDRRRLADLAPQPLRDPHVLAA